MKKLLQVLPIALIFSSSAIAENKLTSRVLLASSSYRANDASISEDSNSKEISIRNLLEITHSKKNFEQLITQMDQIVESATKELVSAQELSPEKQKKIELMQAKMAALVKEEMNWEKIEAMSIDIYAQAFTQKEIDSMLGFYKSPEGQAILEKMPVVMQLTFQNMQGQMSTLTKKLQALQNETTAELNEITVEASEK